MSAIPAADSGGMKNLGVGGRRALPCVWEWEADVDGRREVGPLGGRGSGALGSHGHNVVAGQLAMPDVRILSVVVIRRSGAGSGDLYIVGPQRVAPSRFRFFFSLAREVGSKDDACALRLSLSELISLTSKVRAPCPRVL